MLKKTMGAIAVFLFFSALNMAGVYLFDFTSKELMVANLILAGIILTRFIYFCKKCACGIETQIQKSSFEISYLKQNLEEYQLLSEQCLNLLCSLNSSIRKVFGHNQIQLPRSTQIKLSLAEAKKWYQLLSESFFAKELEQLSTCIRDIDLIVEIYHKIPYLNQLLQNVVSKTEDSAMNLIEKFDLIATEIRKSSSEAEKTSQNLQKGENGKSFSIIINDTKTAITKDNQLIKDLVDLNQNNSEKLVKIMDLIEKINHGLMDIISLSDKNKTISFNLSIEAVKLGEKGKGVMMIVHEIQKFNQMAHDTTKEISGYMKTFRGYNELLMKDWISKTEEIIKNIKNTNDKSEEVILTLLNSYEATSNLFIRLSESTGNVNKSMNKIMESLQFQDITRQQIENINKFLLEIKDSIANSKELFSLMGIDLEKDMHSIHKKIKENWKKQVTVFDERKILE